MSGDRRLNLRLNSARPGSDFQKEGQRGVLGRFRVWDLGFRIFGLVRVYDLGLLGSCTSQEFKFQEYVSQ